VNSTSPCTERVAGPNSLRLALRVRDACVTVPGPIIGCPRNGTYTGDPHLGLTAREAFLEWKSNQEVRCAVESGIRVRCRS
jgi:hypothetical protein